MIFHAEAFFGPVFWSHERKFTTSQEEQEELCGKRYCPRASCLSETKYWIEVRYRTWSKELIGWMVEAMLSNNKRLTCGMAYGLRVYGLKWSLKKDRHLKNCPREVIANFGEERVYGSSMDRGRTNSRSKGVRQERVWCK